MKLTDRLVVVERDEYRAILYDAPEDPTVAEYRVLAEYPVAIGARRYSTRRGQYRVVTKDRTPEWTRPASDWVPEELWHTTVPYGDPANPIKGRWIGFTNYGVGFHGTDDIDSIGTRASHGCVRMLVPDVIDLFDRVEKGTPVYVV